MSLRAFGKFCFLVVIVGFLMPISCDMNGFQWAHSYMSSSWLSFALYGLFISACIGSLLGILLLAKINIPIYIDWLVIIAVSCFGLIPFFYNLKSVDMFQEGVWVMLSGGVLAIICQIIYHVRK